MEIIQLNDLEKQRAEDLRWALHSGEVQQHAGKLVAVRRKRVLGYGVDRESLIAETANTERCPAHDIVVVVVPGQDMAETPK
ncbi:MAG: hypothetical protein HYX68_12565 [Planctomycetes bacterium]|jgi:hypothetical protein|nr:hypothetical protein [Planctomycetota bacterium]